MAAKFSVFLTLLLPVLLLLYSGRLRVISSTSDAQQHLIDRAQKKLDDMTLSMRKSGYGMMSEILHENLERFIRECGFMQRNITIFAPRDEAMVFAWFYLPPIPGQILTLRVDEYDFWRDHMVKGTHLYPCEPMTIVNITEHPKYNIGRLSIGNARVLHYDIYQDDHIVVHGVDSFFDVTYRGSTENNSLRPWSIPWPIHPALPGVNFDRVY